MGDGEGQSGNSTGEGAWPVDRVLVPVLDVLIMVTGVAGHVLVVLIITGRRRRVGAQGPPGTDTLLLALSVSDLLLLACLPFHTVAVALGRWPFGNPLCKAVSFLGVTCSTASVLTLAALAVTRYLTVVRPSQAYRWRGHKRLRLAAAGLWVPAAALAAPQLAFRTVGATGPLYCFSFLSDVTDQLLYGVFHFLVAFALPLAVIVTMYGKIYRFLAQTRRAGRAPQVELYQRRVTQTSATLVLAFTLCWLPSYALIFCLVGETAASAPHYRPLAVFARLLAASSTVANPVLYVFMSSKFRKDLAEIARGRGVWGSCCAGGVGGCVRPSGRTDLGSPPQS